MLLLWTVSAENLMRYDIVCEFVLCTFNLRDSQQRESVCQKKTTLENICLYLFILWLKPKHVNTVKASLSINSIHPTFPIFSTKMIKICTL